jgi:hypothetical protein
MQTSFHFNVLEDNFILISTIEKILRLEEEGFSIALVSTDKNRRVAILREILRLSQTHDFNSSFVSPFAVTENSRSATKHSAQNVDELSINSTRGDSKALFALEQRLQKIQNSILTDDTKRKRLVILESLDTILSVNSDCKDSIMQAYDNGEVEISVGTTELHCNYAYDAEIEDTDGAKNGIFKIEMLVKFLLDSVFNHKLFLIFGIHEDNISCNTKDLQSRLSTLRREYIV